MLELTPEQVEEYLRRGFSAADGLWFMKVEERYGFDTALDIDNEVWKVLPKIQARLLKAMAGPGDGLEALFECFTTKLKLDGFTFTAEKLPDGRGFRIITTRCPWHEAMVRSGREKLSGKVGSRVCRTEFSGWAAEFGGGIRLEMLERICGGGDACLLQFGQ